MALPLIVQYLVSIYSVFFFFLMNVDKRMLGVTEEHKTQSRLARQVRIHLTSTFPDHVHALTHTPTFSNKKNKVEKVLSIKDSQGQSQHLRDQPKILSILEDDIFQASHSR